MKIRLALIEDLPQLHKIYASARSFMVKNGNPTQWGTSYPEDNLLREDIAANRLYVGEDHNGVPHFAFVVAFGEDPSYGKIDGAWLNDEPYVTIHKVAGDGVMKGVFAAVVDFTEEKCSNIRIDTHADNKNMQRLILENGFSYCGVITFLDGTPRLAYQRKG
jgi:RimJ/RimL family protein N-acetyltransferase